MSEREEPATTIDECIDEAKGKLGPRCDEAGFPKEGKDRQACGEAQEAVMDELRMWLLNEEDLYNNGPRSRRYPYALSQAREFAHGICDRRFKPNAEEELVELRKPTAEYAKEIANMLWEPFIQQFIEIPREKRVEAYNRCKKAVGIALSDLDKLLREKWTKPF